jgi:hypothetical protein
MNDADVRWKKRFENFKNALAQLDEADDLSRQRPLLRLENQGLIKAFEFTYELAWNTLRDFLVCFPLFTQSTSRYSIGSTPPP